MEGPQRRDINELLTHGFFTTARGKSPSKPASHTNEPSLSSSASFLKTPASEPPRDRSRSRVRRHRPPPPTVEDEHVSLAREASGSSRRSNCEPPLRGIIDQVPIILEADVTKAEAARLQAEPRSKETEKETDDNPERRFVFIPRLESSDEDDLHSGRRKVDRAPKVEAARREERREAPKREERKVEAPRREERKEEVEVPRREERREKVEAPRREDKKEIPQPPISRRRSRQDLPSLETKVPRDIPPQYRRSASAFSNHDHTPKATPRTPSGESFLSPDVSRGKKDYFPSMSAPRFQEAPAGRAPNGNRPSSRPSTPNAEKRNSGSFESRSRRNTNEKMTRPQQLSEEYASRRTERQASAHSGGHSSRGSNNSNRRYYSSSDDDIADSDSDEDYKKYEHKSHKKVRDEVGYDRLKSPSRSNRSSFDKKGSSKYNSPFASPKVSPSQIPRGDQPFERSETFPRDKRDISRPVSPLSPALDTPRGDKLNPTETKGRPRSKSNAPASKPQPMASAHHPSLPIPIPIPSRIDLHSPGDTRKSPAIPQYDENRGARRAPSPNPKPDWNPGSFQPPSTNLEMPIGSVRRHSEDIERGSIAPLPSCPRTNFTKGRNDWLTLPNCPAFDICPSCFSSSIAPTEFRKHFVQAPPRSPETAVLCDFGSSPWYRIAWLLTLKEKRQSLKLFYGLANITANEAPCLGKHEAARKWHSITDPKTGSHIHNFDVCYSCVKSVEVLLPAIKGVFIRTDAKGPEKRVCDLRFDSKRFIQYFDALEITADRAYYDDTDPDTRDLAHLARRLAAIPECQHDAELVDRKWHVITQLPEFTVCEECYQEIVVPELDDRKAIPLLFNKVTQRLPKASCQLYSPKMRGIFRTAVDADDYKLLASKARERKAVETAFKYNMGEWKRRERAGESMQREIRKGEDEWRRWE
ncbi:hypothetical protein LSUE1_G010063 [Lachnellula suecica]|uniref:Uncharacterized protein n=1 Tax=Lachnellula suecica TaxID=602035 RepID=A0A8T9BRX2_9HELO|nr:hypothetical protein LSUE1_G010063 [Lachnellula suecica]